MKAKVTAIIKNSHVFPVDTITVEEIVEFPENENVFGRVLTARQHFKKRYGEEIDLEIRNVEWLS